MTSTRFIFAAVAALALTAVAGCSSNASRVSSLPAAPSGGAVTAQRLPPPPGTTPPMQNDMNAAGGQQLGEDGMMAPGADAPPQDFAAATPGPAPSGPPSKESVLGQWSIAGAGERCQIVVSLTGWEGGHRASTRGCGSPELKNIGAWNIEGNYVVLKDNDGNAIGRLAQAGTGYQGRLELGGSVAMSR